MDNITMPGLEEIIPRCNLFDLNRPFQDFIELSHHPSWKLPLIIKVISV